MGIQKDDYVEGFEYYGPNNKIRKTKGWVDKVHQWDGYTVYDIQANDSYGGTRGTTLTTKLGEVIKLATKDRPARVS